MPWARASALSRHLECPAASWLPRLDRGKWSPGYLAEGVFVAPDVVVAERDDSAARWGTGMHLAKSDPTHPDANALQVAAMDDWREKLWPSHLGIHEQCVAFDCRTQQVVLGPAGVSKEEADRWKAEQSPDSVTGECDWWASLPLGEPWIDDLKTGWRTPEVVTPQTLFYLMCKCKLEGVCEGRVSITHWPKAAEAPTREGLWRSVGPLALEGFEDDLHHAWVRALGVNPEPRPGPHCQYCPSASVCSRAFE